MGIPLDEILGTAGWTTSETFLRNYMKPLAQKPKNQGIARPKSVPHSLNSSNNAQKLAGCHVVKNQSHISASKMNRKSYNSSDNGQLGPKHLSLVNKKKLSMPQCKIDSPHPSPTGKLGKVKQRDFNAGITSGSNLSVDKRNMRMQSFSSQLSGKH